MTEVRITSATGGQKGSKPAQLGAIDPLALLKLAEVAGFGAQKYDSFNYLKGYDWSLSFNAMQRHALEFWNGEDNDPESGLPHPLHIAWHGLCLASFLMRELGTDDRYKQPAQEQPEEPEAKGVHFFDIMRDVWLETPEGFRLVGAPGPDGLSVVAFDYDVIARTYGVISNSYVN